MAELIICEKQDLVNIASAVRSKTGSTKQMDITEIADKIEEIGGGATSLPTYSLQFPLYSDNLFGYNDTIKYSYPDGNKIRISTMLLNDLLRASMQLNVAANTIIAFSMWTNDLIPSQSLKKINDYCYLITNDSHFTLSDRIPQ